MNIQKDQMRKLTKLNKQKENLISIYIFNFFINIKLNLVITTKRIIYLLKYFFHII